MLPLFRGGIMTIKDIIDKLDKLKPNQYRLDEKMSWLSDLDARVVNDIIQPHQREKVEIKRYTDTGDTLLVEDAYSEMYLHYMMAQIDYHNAEHTRYNNSSAAFNEVFTDYARHYKRTHMPVSSRWKGL